MAVDPTDPRIAPVLTGAKLAVSSGFDLKIAPSVVLVYDQSLVPPRAIKRHHRAATHPFRQVGSLQDGVDIVVSPGPGAPVAAITIEFMAAMGVEQLMCVGQAGLLRASNGHDPSTHHSYVITRAESDEGTARHYSNNLTASKHLTAAMFAALDVPTGVALTTDVPFRHTPARLAAHRARADLVEMECAAVFSAAHHFGIKAGAVLVASDVFDDAGWRQLPTAGVQRSLQQAVQRASIVLANES